jgi:hypothetical protein
LRSSNCVRREFSRLGLTRPFSLSTKPRTLRSENSGGGPPCRAPEGTAPSKASVQLSIWPFGHVACSTLSSPNDLRGHFARAFPRMSSKKAKSRRSADTLCDKLFCRPWFQSRRMPFGSRMVDRRMGSTARYKFRDDGVRKRKGEKLAFIRRNIHIQIVLRPGIL